MRLYIEKNETNVTEMRETMQLVKQVTLKQNEIIQDQVSGYAKKGKELSLTQNYYIQMIKRLTDEKQELSHKLDVITQEEQMKELQQSDSAKTYAQLISECDYYMHQVQTIDN